MTDKYSMSVNDNVEYAKRMIVDSIYREARVEGINVTFPETQQVVDGSMVSGLSYEDTTKIINLKHSWYFILDSLEYPFDLRYIRHINACVESNLIQNAGVVRRIMVRISGADWQPPIPTIPGIEAEMERIRSFECHTERALELMLSIMRGQHFEDGNKRTAQLLANHELIQNGCGVLSIPEKVLAEFSRLLAGFYETGERDEIKDFLHAECISGYTRIGAIAPEEAQRQREEDRKAVEDFLRKKR